MLLYGYTQYDPFITTLMPIQHLDQSIIPSFPFISVSRSHSLIA